MIASEQSTYYGLPFTLASVEVRATLKGGPTVGRTITVVETGGELAGRSKDVPGEFGEPREVGWEGVPVMSPGEEYVLFLFGPTHVGPVESGAFSVAGVAQGKVRIGKDGFLQFTGLSAALDDPAFAVPQALTGARIDEAITEIRSHIE